jgi:hypothetical protein
VCLYLSLIISFLLFWQFFFLFWDRKHYYIKVVENIQFAWTGNAWISRDLCNANTYRSIHEGLFINSSPALDLKYPLRLAYIHFYQSSLHNTLQCMASIHKYFNQSDWLLYFSGRGGYSSHMIKKMVIAWLRTLQGILFLYYLLHIKAFHYESKQIIVYAHWHSIFKDSHFVNHVTRVTSATIKISE